MPSSFVDVCRYNPTLGGTTDWTYSSAVTGYQSPTAAGVINGAIYSYRAESSDLTQWEMGYGAYNTGTGVLSRTTVLFNSLGTTAKISFSSAPQVAIVALAEDLRSFQMPQGRLTLQTLVPVMVTTQSAKTTIYYTPYDGNLIPLYDGANLVPTPFSEISQATTDATKSPAAVTAEACYDIFGWNDAGTIRATRGPSWTTTATITVTIATPAVVTWTAHGLTEGAPVIFTNSGGALPTGIVSGTIYYVGRSPATNTFNISTTAANASAGTFVATSGSQSGTHTGENRTTVRGTGTALTLVNGIYLNNASITNGPAASRGTYLGTIKTNASSQVDWIFGAASAGGTASVLGVWNAYNRVSIPTTVTDTTSSWTYAVSSTWGQLNGSTGNQISIVRGLDEDAAQISFIAWASGGAGTNAVCGVGVGSTTAFSGATGLAGQPGLSTNATSNYFGLPGIGYRTIAALQYNTTATASTWYGNTVAAYINNGLSGIFRM